MVKTKLATLARIAPVFALFSCAAPKATVVNAPTPQTEAAPAAPAVEVTRMAPDDGLRLPDMLAMPGDAEFRATKPTPTAGATGTVTVRPPTDPPSRPKPATE